MNLSCVVNADASVDDATHDIAHYRHRRDPGCMAICIAVHCATRALPGCPSKHAAASEVHNHTEKAAESLYAPRCGLDTTPLPHVLKHSDPKHAPNDVLLLSSWLLSSMTATCLRFDMQATLCCIQSKS